ncbi:hypothetical protein BG452_15870 [Streptomyces sp. CBMA123]|nr:hypothetical protein [Streptomyces sp. CBMA123]
MVSCDNSMPPALFGPSRTFLDIVTPERWKALVAGLDRIRLPAHRSLMRQGTVGAQVMFVLNGVLRVDQIGGGSEDRWRLRNFRRCGDVLGDLAVLGSGVRTASVTTCTECEMALMPGELFRGADFRSEYGLELAEYIAGREREAQMLSRPGDDLARVACVLVPLLGDRRTAEQAADGIRLKVSRKDIAGCLGIGPRALRRITAELPFGGTPEGRRKLLVVADPAGLRAAAERLGGRYPQVG